MTRTRRKSALTPKPLPTPSPKLQMLFKIYGRQNHIMPILPSDIQGRPRVPDNKTMLSIKQASRRSVRLTELQLAAIYDATWGNLLPADA